MFNRKEQAHKIQALKDQALDGGVYERIILNREALEQANADISIYRAIIGLQNTKVSRSDQKIISKIEEKARSGKSLGLWEQVLIGTNRREPGL